MSAVAGNSELSPAKIRAELSRVLTAPEFVASRQLTEFLCYVVEESLAGREEHLKERSIALGALERDEDFDPRTDCIVRVVAGKLRAALDRYYTEEGAASDLVIVVPKGGYRPMFRTRQPLGDHQRTPQLKLPAHDNGNSVERARAWIVVGQTPHQIVTGLVVLIVAVAVLGYGFGYFTNSPKAPHTGSPVLSPGIERVQQTGALPYRIREGTLEVLLVRTLRDSHWTIPKATQEPSQTVQQTAAAEAFREAGVIGSAASSPLGDYYYQRGNRWYCVSVYPVLVREEADSWPEMSRGRQWCEIDTAVGLIPADELGSLVGNFDPGHP